MLEKVEFKNFKMLRDATLPLSPFTLIVGPNASGKSTALEAMRLAIACVFDRTTAIDQNRYLSIGAKPGEDIRVVFHGRDGTPGFLLVQLGPTRTFQGPEVPAGRLLRNQSLERIPPRGPLADMLGGLRHFAFDSRRIAEPAPVRPIAALAQDGSGLAMVLTRMQDDEPERFEALNAALSAWLPDYDRILFETPAENQRAIALRPRGSKNAKIRAADLSDGTLVVLALLTLAYLPEPPTIVTVEEPDRGIHPRLLRRLQDAFYRLCYPKSAGEKRAPVQVVATTHSPYFLNLFREHPEEIVIAEKKGLTATFSQLSKHNKIYEILEDAQLGEAWYTGILGGVPIES